MLQRKIRPLSTMAIQIQWQPPRIARSALARNCADRILVNNQTMNDFLATLAVVAPDESMVLQICSSSPTSCSKPRKQHEAARVHYASGGAAVARPLAFYAQQSEEERSFNRR